MKSVARRVSDRRMLHLIKMGLAPVEETDEQGRRRRTTRNKDEGRGPRRVRQFHRFYRTYTCDVSCWLETARLCERLDAQIVNYADDFVICCRGTAVKAQHAMQDMMNRLKLTVNAAKTHVCRVPDDSFDFLGYTIGRCWSTTTGRSYIGTRPSQKRVARLCRAISAETSRRWLLTDAEERVRKLNRMLVGWANYFCLGPVAKPITP
jgi:hypothetical protein